MTDRRCCEGSINPGSGPDCGPWCVEAPVEDMSAGADLTGVDGNVTEAQGAEVRVANRQSGDYASYGPDLTVEGPCTQQPAVCGSCEAPVSEEMDRTIRRLLGSLDQARHDRLATLHGGTAPDVLCSTCFLPTIGTLNRTAVSRAG